MDDKIPPSWLPLYDLIRDALIDYLRHDFDQCNTPHQIEILAECKEDMKGTKTIVTGNPAYASSIDATAGSNPMTATITIGSGTVYYGVRPTNAPPNSDVSRSTSGMSISTGGESYWVGNAVGEGSLEAVINFASPPYTANYNWESALDYTAALNNTSGGSFGIAYGNSILGKWLQYADGFFKVTSITEIGPIGPLVTPHIFFLAALPESTSTLRAPVSPCRSSSANQSS